RSTLRFNSTAFTAKRVLIRESVDSSWSRLILASKSCFAETSSAARERRFVILAPSSFAHVNPRIALELLTYPIRGGSTLFTSFALDGWAPGTATPIAMPTPTRNRDFVQFVVAVRMTFPPGDRNGWHIVTREIS